MECKNCGTPNQDDAVFCKNCGSRLDGMRACPACGKLTPADGLFCIYCGADKNAPPRATFAAKYFGGERSARQEAAAANAGEAAPEVAATAVEGNGVAVLPEGEGAFVFEKRRGLLKKVSNLFAVLAALVGIIFVFLIESSVSLGTGGVSAGASSGMDIFYFFGDAYDAITGYNAYVENALTAGTVFGTVCCVVGMAVTVICFLAAAVRVLKKFNGKNDKGVLAPCAATFISFVCTAILFMLCVAQSYNISATGADMTLKTSLGGAAIAGIALGAVFLAISVVTDVMANLKAGCTRRSILNCVFGVAILIVAFVAFGIMAGGVAGYSFDLDGEISYKYGAYSLFFELIAGSAPTTSDSDFYTMYSLELFFNIVIIIAAIVLSVLLISVLSKILGGSGADISPKTIKLTIFAGVCAVICGVMMIACSQVFVNWYSDAAGAEIASSMAAPIVVIVFGILLAVVAVVYKKRDKINALAPYLAG